MRKGFWRPSFSNRATAEAANYTTDWAGHHPDNGATALDEVLTPEKRPVLKIGKTPEITLRGFR